MSIKIGSLYFSKAPLLMRRSLRVLKRYGVVNSGEIVLWVVDQFGIHCPISEGNLLKYYSFDS